MVICVVGASLSGVRTVQALRRKGCTDRIVLVGAEDGLPYDRPPLSKGVLLGTIEPTGTALVTEAEISALDLELHLGVAARSLDLAQRAVELADGRRVAFDVVVVATGAYAHRPFGAGRRAGVHALRTVDDARAIRAALLDSPRVAVIGAGFIGAEVASAARSLGLDVTVIDPLPVMMARAVGSRIGSLLARRHADAGVALRLGRSVSAVDGVDERVERVVLDDGSSVAADLVVVGVGAAPNVEWLRSTGLDVARGVRCGADLAVIGAEGVYAVGDVAWSAAHAARSEHWTNAVDQADLVAASILGLPAPAGGGGNYVWSDQLDTRLQVFGTPSDEHELTFVEGSADSAEFVAVTSQDGRLSSVVAWGARRAAMRHSRLLSAGAAWPPATA